MYHELYELYLRCFPEYPAAEEVFCQQLAPKAAHIISERKNGKLVGFAMVHGGSIPLLCVDGEARKQGIGSQLLEEAEAYIRSLGEEKVTLGCGAHYLLQGAPATEENIRFFEKRGYSAGWTSVNMELSLEGFSLESLRIPPAPEGLAYRFAEPVDMPALLAAVKDAEPSWTGIFETCIDPIFLAELDGQIAGFEILTANGGRFLRPGQQVGCVGCVGVVPTMRERGIGMAMVAQGIQWLKEQGCTLIELRYVWLTGWYGKLGFQTAAKQWMGEKSYN